LRKKLIAYHLS
jgi:ABC-type transport system involved in multi-copper enzyme maturation permease subunit